MALPTLSHPPGENKPFRVVCFSSSFEFSRSWNWNRIMPRTNYHVSITPHPGCEASPPPYRDYYPVTLCNGTRLNLPIQPLPGGREAIALLMSNQTPFEVEKELSSLMSRVAAEFSAEVIVGIPTLGLDYARIVARDLGF